MTFVRLVAPLLAVAALPAQKGLTERVPDAKAVGKVYAAKSGHGLAYHYYLPKSYDPEKGITLTFILHGSNLDRNWGFLNHEAGAFRADDLVVCPDGTTSNGRGGFNFLQGRKDLERLHALHEELKEVFEVNATYLYGHSQGSFFAFLYAGAYPEDVQGLVGQASGVWIGTQASKKHHHQAVVLMHGTKDPVVPYGQSVGGLEFYLDAKYPLVRLRSLEGWNHWPNQVQTGQQLAWCEGMTTGDPDRLVAAFTTLADAKEWVDPVALYQVAARAAAAEGVAAKVQKAAQAAMAEVDKCAEAHAKAIGKGGKKLEAKAWVGHLPLFLRDFRGVPACDELAEAWRKTLDKQQKAVGKHARAFWKNRQSKPKEAFAAGVALVREAFLTSAADNEEILASLEEWADEGRAIGLSKRDLKEFKATVPVLREAREKGRKAFKKVDKRLR